MLNDPLIFNSKSNNKNNNNTSRIPRTLNSNESILSITKASLPINNDSLNNNYLLSNNHVNLTKTDIDKILKKDRRTDEEAIILLKKLKELSFFQKFHSDHNLEKLEDDAMIYLCKKIKYKKYDPGVFIFKEGDTSDGRVYIIYSGYVLVIIKHDINVYATENLENQKKLEKDYLSRRSSIIKDNTKQNANDKAGITVNTKESYSKKISRVMNAITTNNYIRKTIMRKNSIIELSDNKSKSVENQNLTNNNNNHALEYTKIKEIAKSEGIVVDKLYKGEIFGEKALTIDIKRKASILTGEACEFLIITCKDYINIKEKYDKAKKLKRDFILYNFPDMKNINSENILDSYSYHLKDEVYNMNSLIIEEGQHGDSIYILYEGLCEISKKVKIEEKRDTKLINLNSQYKNIIICNIESGTFFGEEILKDMGENNNNDLGIYEYNVKAISSAIRIFSIKKKTFLHRFPIKCVNDIKETYLKKKAAHERILKTQIQAQFKRINIYIENKQSSSMPIESSGLTGVNLNDKSFNVVKKIQYEDDNNRILLNEGDELITTGRISLTPNIDDNNDPELIRQNIKNSLYNIDTSFKIETCIIDTVTNNNNDNNNNNNQAKPNDLLQNSAELKNLHLKLNNRDDILNQYDKTFSWTNKYVLKLRRTSRSRRSTRKNIEENFILEGHSLGLGAGTGSVVRVGSAGGTRTGSKTEREIIASRSSSKRPSTAIQPMKRLNKQESLKTHRDTSAIQLRAKIIKPYNGSGDRGINSKSKDNRMGSLLRSQGSMATLNPMGMDEQSKRKESISKKMIIPSNTIRSKVDKSRDWQTYFKNLEQNFESLRKKSQGKNDIFLTEVSNVKLDLFLNDKDKLNNNNEKATEDKPLKYQIGRLIRKKHDKVKVYYERKSSKMQTTTLTMNSERTYSDPQLMRNRKSTPSLTMMNTSNEFKKMMTKSSDIKAYLIKLKSKSPNKQDTGNLSYRETFITSSFSPPSIQNIDYGRPRSSLSSSLSIHKSLNNKHDFETPEQILQWKYQNFLARSRLKTSESIRSMESKNQSYQNFVGFQGFQ